MRAGIDHRATALLGIVTICSYGSWYYAFGVLLDPIRLDTGWRESTLTTSFSAGTIVIGLGSIAGGRLLDGLGPRRVFLAAAVIGSGALLAASFATSPGVFLIASATGLGTLGALGFYHVTMATTVRLNPADPARAIAVLTVWGALASAIYLPLTAALVQGLGWRNTVRVLAASSAGAFVLAAAALPSVQTAPTSAGRSSLSSVVRSAVAPGGPRSFAVAVSCGGIAMSTLLVYQVPTMTSLGLPAATAATFAGVRGFAQLGGRLPLGRIVGRLGVDRSLTVAFLAIAAGGLILSVADNRPTALVFAVVAGFGIGAFSPLQGIKAQELFDGDSLGATMGFYGSLMMLVGSIGPALAGVVAETTGERRLAAALVVVAALGAALAAPRSHSDPTGAGR